MLDCSVLRRSDALAAKRLGGDWVVDGVTDVFFFEERTQLGFEQLRIHAFGNADDTFENEFHIL